MDDLETVRQLLAAAADGGARLIRCAAGLTGGWAVLTDPLAGAVHAWPPDAARDGEQAAAAPHRYPHCTVQPAAGAVLVLAPACGTPDGHAALVARTTAAAFAVRARHAAELRPEQMRLHTALLGLLLAGRTTAVTDILGTPVTHATVCRLTGPGLCDAHHTLWRSLRPVLTPGAPTYTLISLTGCDSTDLAVIDLHRPGADSGRTLRLANRLAERHHLLGGLAGPVPLGQTVTAHADALTAQRHATPHHRITPASALASRALTRTLPPHLHTSWAATELQPLTPAHRHTLDVWLRAGTTARTAAALGISPATLRARLTSISRLLNTDITDPLTRALLLLALRAPTRTDAPPTPPTGHALGLHTLPHTLLDTTATRRWADGLTRELDTRLRIALRCWLRHDARTAPAATELCIHRTTLTQWLNQAADRLGLDLTDPTTRAELLLALETGTTAPSDLPAALPRRASRTYRT